MNEPKTIDELLNCLNLPYSIDSIKEYPFDFIRSVCSVYDDDVRTATSDRLNDTRQLLKVLPSICHPKELLLALLEEANSFKTYEKFSSLLEPINDCLLLIPVKRHQSVVLAFETLCAHIECEPLPDYGADCIENLDAVQISDALEDNISLFLSYFKKFVCDAGVKLSNAIKNDENIYNLKFESSSLSLILLKLFARPLAYKKCNFIAGNSEMFCLNLFSHLQTNGIKFIFDTLQWKAKNDYDCKQFINGKENEKIEIVKSIEPDDTSEKMEKITWDVETGLGTLAFALFNEQYIGDLIPQIYTPSYLFLNHLNLITHLLSIRKPNSHPADKGCSLIMYFLKRIGTSNMSDFSIDQDGMRKFIEKLIEISTTSNVKEISQKCLACLNAFIWCLKPSGRIELLNFALRSTKHSGLLGFIITAIKNQVDESLKNGDNVFVDDALDRFNKVIFKLHVEENVKNTENSTNANEAKQTANKINILDETDRIMSCLNFLRFLLLKSHQITDKGNLINVKNWLPLIQANFITPLKSELVRLRADGLSELSYLQNDRPETAPLTEVTIGDETINNISVEDKLKMARIVLTNIDLIESVLIRTETLISNPSDGSNAIQKPNLALPNVNEYLKVKCDHKSLDGANASNEISCLAMKLNSRISPL